MATTTRRMPTPVAENPNSAAMAAMPNAPGGSPASAAPPPSAFGVNQIVASGVAPKGMPGQVAKQQGLSLPAPPPVQTPVFGAPPGVGGAPNPNAPAGAAQNLRPGATTPQAPGVNLDQTYNDIMSSMDKNFAGQQQMLQNQATNGQRLAAITNARAGRNSLGGGAAMLNAQAMVGSQNEMAKAGLADNERRQGLMMDFLGKRLDEQHRGEERAWSLQDQANNQDFQSRLLQMQLAGENPTMNGRPPVTGGAGGASGASGAPGGPKYPGYTSNPMTAEKQADINMRSGVKPGSKVTKFMGVKVPKSLQKIF